MQNGIRGLGIRGLGRGAAALAAATLLAGAGARAATLEWEGSLFVSLGQSQAVAATGTGVATVNGSGGLGALDSLRLAGGISTTTVVPLTDPAVTQVTRITAMVTLGTGTLGPGNTLPVAGHVTVRAFFGFITGNIPLTVAGTRGVGIGPPSIAGAGAISLYLTGAPWTLGVASTPSSTAAISGFAHGPASGTSSTALPGGALQLVTPSRVSSGLLPTPVPVLTALRLRFVPEPGLALLLAAGVGALAGLGRRRRA